MLREGRSSDRTFAIPPLIHPRLRISDSSRADLETEIKRSIEPLLLITFSTQPRITIICDRTRVRRKMTKRHSRLLEDLRCLAIFGETERCRSARSLVHPADKSEPRLPRDKFNTLLRRPLASIVRQGPSHPRAVQHLSCAARMLHAALSAHAHAHAWVHSGRAFCCTQRGRAPAIYVGPSFQIVRDECVPICIASRRH